MRAVVGVVLGIVAPAVLIGIRLFTQQWALSGPAGGSGTLDGERVVLAAKIGARVVERSVREGVEVQQGDVLVRLDCAEPDAALAEARARLNGAIAQADAALALAEAAGVQTSAAAISSEAAAEQAQAVAAQRDAAGRQADRVAALDDGTSPATVDQSTTSASALSHQSEAASAQARVARLQVGLARGNAAAAGANARAAAEVVAAIQAAVARAELMVAECVITAPRGGVVETLAYEVGELVPPGFPLVTLVDLSEVRATFYLPNAELAAAVVGQAAEVTADAWPDDRFGATVLKVASEAAFTPRNVQTRTDRDRLVYAVEVAIPNPDRKLRPGMPVQITLVE